MKAHELANLTKRAIEKKNKERPTEVFNDLMSKMKSQAESGYNYINFCFSDSEEIVIQVLDMLSEEGYSIKRNDGPKKNITKISWEKTNQECSFDRCWVGRCKEPADMSGYCEEHKKAKCSCGRQATHDCEATIGAFVCGRLLCGHCRCHH